MRFGPWEIIIVVMFVVILFGARRIPEIMKGLGSGIREFKTGLHDDGEEKTSSSAKAKDEGKTGN